MSRIPEFINLLDVMKAVHIKKNEDYATEFNPYENFERAAELVSWFKRDIDKVFVTLIGVKLARLAVLTSSNKEPNNESINDTRLDLCNYAALWAVYDSFEMRERDYEPPCKMV